MRSSAVRPSAAAGHDWDGAVEHSTRRRAIELNEPDMGPYVVVDGLHKWYGNVHALQGVTFEVAKGSIHAILGPNGAGKTTLATVLAGLAAADAGVALVQGYDTQRDASTVRSIVGYAPQETAVYPTLTVEQNLKCFGNLRSLRRAALRGEIARVAALLQLEASMGRRVARLSGGERRRVHTAAALMGKPPFLILDEPTVGMDVSGRHELLTAIKDMAASGTTICYLTHYMAEVESLDANVTVLSHGKVLASDSLGQLLESYGSVSVVCRFSDDIPDDAFPSFAAHRAGRDLTCVTAEPEREVTRIVLRAAELGLALERIDIRRQNLEAVFMGLVDGDMSLPGSDPTSRELSELAGRDQGA